MRWLLACAVACYSPASLSPASDGAIGMDGPGSDTGPDGGATCVDSFFLGQQLCGLGPDLFETGAKVVTSCTRALPQSGGDTLCVFTGNNVTLTDLSIHGSQPVAYVALHSLIVDTKLDVSTPDAAGRPGANGDFSGCGTVAPAGGIRGGGAGGSFAGRGGNGVSGTVDSGGVATPSTAIPTIVRGGCPGGNGGGGASGGGGGGAIYLLAGDQITITASTQVLSNGQPGTGGAASQGGGGGGTGGLLVVESQTISTDPGVIFEAIGGGGGGGGGDQGAGTSGKSCLGGGSGSGALGGSGANGTNGGACNTTAVDAQQPGTAADGGGGGGGGGGAGFILVHTSGTFPQIGGFPAPTAIP